MNETLQDIFGDDDFDALITEQDIDQAEQVAKAHMRTMCAMLAVLSRNRDELDAEFEGTPGLLSSLVNDLDEYREYLETLVQTATFAINRLVLVRGTSEGDRHE